MRAYAPSGMIIIALSLALIAGCSDSSTSPDTGRLRLHLVDLPAQYDQVNIVVTEVEVHVADADSGSGWETIRDDTATYDLLVLRNGADAILGDRTLPVGRYTQIRLHIGSGSNVVVDGVRFDLDISANNTIKLNHTFTIEPGQLYELTLDFDADRSIVLTGNGQYKLMPVIRVMANVVSGTISGTVHPVEARAVVTTFTGMDTLSAFCDTINGYFKLMMLPEGTYNLMISPADTSYADTTISGIPVTAQQDTNIGTVTLSLRP